MIENATVAVNGTAVQVSTNTLSPNGDEIGPHTVVVQVPSDEAAVVLGAFGVTVENGIVVSPGQSIVVDLGRNERLYALAVSAPSNIRVMRHGVNA